MRHRTARASFARTLAAQFVICSNSTLAFAAGVASGRNSKNRGPSGGATPDYFSGLNSATPSFLTAAISA